MIPKSNIRVKVDKHRSKDLTKTHHTRIVSTDERMRAARERGMKERAKKLE